MKAMTLQSETGPQAGARVTRSKTARRRHDRMPLYQGFMRALFTALLVEVSERLRLNAPRSMGADPSQSS